MGPPDARADESLIQLGRGEFELPARNLLPPLERYAHLALGGDERLVGYVEARRGCRFVLGPYGSDSTRAVATASPGTVVWNHGAAADDVQRLPGVVSLPSPASRYLVALGRAVAALRPGAAIAVVAAGGPFARFAREALECEAPSLGLRLAAFSLRDPPAAIAAARPDAVLACGPHGREVALFRALAGLLSAPEPSGCSQEGSSS